MTIPRPRLTVRRMMILVALASPFLWSMVAAVRVLEDGRRLTHVREFYLVENGGRKSFGHPPPFWPRYWRLLLGRPWPGSYACDCSVVSTLSQGELVATYAGDPLLDAEHEAMEEARREERARLGIPW